VRAKSYNGSTALIIAADKGHSEAVEELVKATDISLDCKSKYEGSTVLMLAAQKGHSRVIEILARAGADVNAKMDRGWSPLLVGLERGRGDPTVLILAAQKGHTGVVELLLRAGADLNSRNQTLMVASKQGNVDMVRILLEANARTPGRKIKGSHRINVIRVATSGSRRFVGESLG
jgi:ankyrin repeat protein